ncbi:MAG: hypothetical protein ABI625_03645 [bacterium]
MPSVQSRLILFPLLNPSLAASDWVFETVGDERWHDHVMARRVRATRRRTGAVPDGESRPSGYWLGVDEYERLVDDDLQILIRLTGIADGKEVASVSLNDVQVDEPLSAGIFSFIAPPGTRVTYVDPLRQWGRS